MKVNFRKSRRYPHAAMTLAGVDLGRGFDYATGMRRCFYVRVTLYSRLFVMEVVL